MVKRLTWIVGRVKLYNDVAQCAYHDDIPTGRILGKVNRNAVPLPVSLAQNVAVKAVEMQRMPELTLVCVERPAKRWDTRLTATGSHCVHIP